MKALVLDQVVPLDENPGPLTLEELPIPKPGAGEVLIRISTCGVCHTGLDEIEGSIPLGIPYL